MTRVYSYGAVTWLIFAVGAGVVACSAPADQADDADTRPRQIGLDAGYTDADLGTGVPVPPDADTASDLGVWLDGDGADDVPIPSADQGSGLVDSDAAAGDPGLSDGDVVDVSTPPDDAAPEVATPEVITPDATVGDCSNLGDGAACDDGDPCTQGDTCHGGACMGGPKLGASITVSPADDWPDVGLQGALMYPRRIAVVGNELRFVISSTENFAEAALVATDMAGHPLWSKWTQAANYSMRGLATTSDGATYFANYPLTRYSASGTVDWERVPPTPVPEPTCSPVPPVWPYETAQQDPFLPDPTLVAGMPDGGVVAAGIATASSVPCCMNQAYLAFATRYDAAGSVIWTWSGCPTADLYTLHEFVRLEGGDFLLLGEGHHAGGKDTTWLIRVSSAGALLWQRDLDGTWCLHLAGLDDDGIGVGCTTYDPKGPALVHRLDANGNVLWSKTLPHEPLEFMLGGLRGAPSGVLVARSSSNGITIRLDAAGELASISTPSAPLHIPSIYGYNAEVYVPGLGYLGAVRNLFEESLPNGPLKLQFYVADEFGQVSCEQSGVCSELTPTPDDQPCTFDNCDPSLGLTYPWATDGQSCAQDGVCQAGVCASAP
jgi:hypothetical protein